ncbi:MAG: succinate dehydrogenase, cytochrome b556 subunit [Chromatiales bacterium]|jgi:succinate dehydrogenase / fumarate reductase cytochrome b subunit
MLKTQKRPVFLNLLLIKLPVAGIMSIGHRIAGVLLFFSLPLWLYLLQLSLESEQGFSQVQAWLSGPLVKLLLFLLLWATVHHLLAGIRYLLLDIDIGIDKPVYKNTARAVLFAAPIISLLILGVSL